jgi:hypothetical protein
MRRTIVMSAALVSAVLITLLVYLLVTRPAKRPDPTDEQLHDALVAVIETLDLRPFGAPSVQPQPVRIKGEATYYAATGLLETDETYARAIVSRTLRQEGWHLVSDEPVEQFLGWRAIGHREGMGICADVGDEASDPAGSPFHAQPGRTYVQLTVARERCPQA